MWVFAYDPADGGGIQRRDMSYWPLRHGSPFRDKTGIWVPTNFVPCLSEFSEVGDLYIGYLSDVPDPKRPKFYTPDDTPERQLFTQLSRLDSGDFALALEFTYHSNWSSNAIQRLPLLYESISREIPTAYALPESAVAMRGTERRGDQNVHHKKLESALRPICKRLVKNNEPVTFEKLQAHLSDSSNDIIAEFDETSENKADPKVPLFCKTAQDTFETPVFTVQYDEVVTAAPRDWKVSGQQLEPVYSAIENAMKYMKNHGIAPTVESGIYDEHNERDQQVMEAAPPDRPYVSRNDRWDDYHKNTRGFPHGSLGLVTSPLKRHSKEHNYSLPSNKLANLYFHPGKQASKNSFNQWADEIGKDRKQRRFYDSVDFASIPNPVRERPMIVTYKVSAYGGGRDDVERWQNVDERTYAGKFMLFDLCYARTPNGTSKRPRAMSREYSDREYVLAVNLPMPSEVMFDQYESNARFSTYIDGADIMIFDDGGYLGRPWWEDDSSPIQIF